MMYNWKIRFEDSLPKIKEIMDFPHKILIGFNVNIDKIIRIHPSIISTFNINSELFQNPSPKILKTKSDLFLSLFYSIKNGKADELLIENEELADWIERNFVIDSSHIGGQAGIMANFLKELGSKHVLLSLPIYHPEMIKLLNPDILSVVDSAESRLKPLKELKKEEKGPIYHYIFEFTTGKYKFGNTEIQCKRSNRFIASFDTINSALKVKDVFYIYTKEAIKNYKIAIIAGFHLLNFESVDEISFHLNSILQLLQSWKKENPALKIHLELAATNNTILIREILQKIFPLVDSIGLNEQELLSFIKIINLDIHNQILNDLSSINLFTGLFSLFSKFPKLRIHLHFIGYYMIISPPLTSLEVEKRFDSLILSSIVAASKVQFGQITKSNLQVPKLVNIDKNGVFELKKLEEYLLSKFEMKETKNMGHYSCSLFSLVAIPTFIVENPKNLVGTGDLISLTSILYESI